MKTLKTIAVSLIILTMASCQKEEIRPNTASQDCTLEQSVQCLGQTQSGNRCQNMTLSCSGFCHHHD